ncbi:MAG: AbrB/MazE/SpoVT family DNA-binding domain-containing protein [Spirochaetaceae bacterium]|nr:MAG: AbrB/MazE/SpoVT family DNA-binding domain-containing protein [Spirochaetaceae bacterium]
MNVTIDRLGRIVVPKQVRDRFHLVAGTSLELEVESDGIRIRPLHQEPALQRKQGVLIHHGPETVSLDMAEFVNRDRANRDTDLVAEGPAE